MTPAAVSVRPETARDAAAIRAVHDAAFGRSDESAIVDAVRSTSDFVPAFSLVAEDAAGRVVGHVLMCRARVERGDAPPLPILVLGPIGVVPAQQRRGVGTALMRAAIGTALAAAEPAIVLLGHPTYYPRFGFEPARRFGLEPPLPWSDEAWMALRLPTWTADLRGVVRLPPAFDSG